MEALRKESARMLFGEPVLTAPYVTLEEAARYGDSRLRVNDPATCSRCTPHTLCRYHGERAQRIARTETLRAHHAATVGALKKEDSFEYRVEFLTEEDDRITRKRP